MAHTQACHGVTPAEFLTFRENFIEDFNYISPKIARYYELELDPDKTWIKLMARVDFGIPFNAPRAVPVIAFIIDRGERVMLVMTDQGQEAYV